MSGSPNGPYVDLVAVDREGKSVVLVEVKTTPAPERAAADELIAYLKALPQAVPFAMLVDRDHIRLFRWDGTSLSPASTLRTADVLRRYDPDFGKGRIFESYLATLVEGWLRDLAYHWKSERAPAAEELDAIGLLPKLEGGGTRSEVELSGGHLHRS
jgi:hypothetical protein